MNEMKFNLTDVRIEISFKSYEELRLRLSFFQKNNLYKINIPCKNNIKKDFLLNSIKISKEEFPDIDIIPHFSIQHEFKRNRINTLNSFIKFLQFIKRFGCNEVLLISGTQKRSTLNSVSTLTYLNEHTFYSKTNFSIGVAFNPYLSSFLFEEEIIKLDKKIKSGFVKSIWIQFGTDLMILDNRIETLENIILSSQKANSKASNINLFGSILIPSKQFLARFKYRPWKGVYCSKDFLESVEFASIYIKNLLEIYKKHEIYPIIETDVSTQDKLNSLDNILKS